MVVVTAAYWPDTTSGTSDCAIFSAWLFTIISLTESSARCRSPAIRLASFACCSGVMTRPLALRIRSACRVSNDVT